MLNKLNIDSEKAKDVAIVAAIAIGIYLMYKVTKGIQEGANKLGFGENDEKAKKIDAKVENMKPEDNPFNPSYAISRINSGSGKNVSLLKAATRENMYKTITSKLGLFQTYKHPFSFLEDRKKVTEYILRNVKTRTQLSNLAQTFKEHRDDLYKVLKEGYREQGITSGGFKAGEIQALFTNMVNKLLELPEGVK